MVCNGSIRILNYLGHSIPHWLGCRALGPDTFLVFSNCELTLVIMPRQEM